MSSPIGERQSTVLTLSAIMSSNILARKSLGRASAVVTLKRSTTSLFTLFKLSLSSCFFTCSNHVVGLDVMVRSVALGAKVNLVILT